MTYELSLRDEILDTTHRWPVIFLFCLAGILIGWGISILWPTTFRASKEIYVGINPYRATEDLNASRHANLVFENPDDYKNWQMANLNSLVKMDWMLQETLERLQKDDPYWLNVTPTELGEMLNVNWRNAGKWRLIADGDNPLRASQAVSAWHNVVLAEIQSATLQAQNTFVYDTHLEALASKQVDLELEILELQKFQVKLKSRQGQIQDSSNLSWNTIKSKRLELEQIISNSSTNFPWLSQFLEIPAGIAPASEYQEWLNQVNYGAELEKQNLENQLNAVKEQYNHTAVQYQTASNSSFGLSSNLRVEKLHDQPPDLYPLRPSGLLILIGGLIGFLLWIALSLIKITR